jgi:hypothetical protein
MQKTRFPMESFHFGSTLVQHNPYPPSRIRQLATDEPIYIGPPEQGVRPLSLLGV